MRQRVRTRKNLKKFLSVFLPVLLAGAVLWGGYTLFDRNYLLLNGDVYSRSITELDLSGQEVKRWDRVAELTGLSQLNLTETGISAEEYEKLQAALPNCAITWEPYFQGVYYPLDTRSLTVTQLTEADVAYLDYFQDLTQVDALGCQDYAAITALIQRRPDCEVSYQVTIGQEVYPKDATFLTITEQDIQATEELLPYLPQVTGILFTGAQESLGEIVSLRQQFPHIIFDYQLDFHGQILASNLVEADFSDLGLTDTQDIETILPYLPDLTRVDVSGCDIPHDQMTALADSWPNIHFVWTFELLGKEVRTDATSLDFSGQANVDMAAIDQVLPYFPKLTEVLVLDCAVDNEEMAALNKKYENISIVWTVHLGPNLRVRSDIDALIPTKDNVWLQDAEAYNLRYCTEIVALDMGHNDVYNIDFAAYMPKLRYFVIADSPISSLEPLRGLENLVYLEAFLTNVTDYSPLLDCPALEDLNISWTYGSYEPLCQMTNLKRLWWGGTPHSAYEVQKLTECLPDTQLVLFDGRSTGSFWRLHQHYYEMRDLLGMFYMQ